MPRIQEASKPATMVCFSHLSPVKLTSVSNTDNYWHPPVTPEIQLCSVPLYPDGISVHCAPVSTKALYFCGSDEPGHRIHTVQYTRSSLSSSWLKAGTLYCCQNIHCLTLAVPDQVSIQQDQGRWFQFFCVWEIANCLLVSQQQLRWQAFLGGPFLTAVFPLSSHTQASSLKVGSPCHFLISSPWSCRKKQSAPHIMCLGLPSPLTGRGED